MSLNSHVSDLGDPYFQCEGTHVAELEGFLHKAPYNQPFTPLLVDSGVLPESLRVARLLPGVTYGLHGTRPRLERIELLPGDSQLLSGHDEAGFFNPHGTLRRQTHTIASTLVGKGKGRIRGEAFGLASYVVENNGGRHLFVGGTEQDLTLLTTSLTEVLRAAYDLKTVVLGGLVVAGELEVAIGGSSLPSIIREIGQNILKLKAGHTQKVELTKAVVHDLNKKSD